jgi:hypothetical protein
MLRRMALASPVLLVGGSPRIAVDAVRHLTVAATGATAIALGELLRRHGRETTLLLSQDASPSVAAQRYTGRDSLEDAIGGWIARHPEGCVVMSAAVNDYRVVSVERSEDGETRALRAGEKLSSGADEVVIRLRSAPKLIDRLRPEFGLRGPIVGFKYEDRATVLASASALQRRVGAVCVLANSLCGKLQAIVDADGETPYDNRQAVLAALAERIIRA